MKAILEYLLGEFVDNPKEVEVKEEKGEQVTVLNLKVAKDDIAKVIGKKGKIIKALRSILRIGALKRGENIYIQISDEK
jgi:predicted RNA-binding protein YlqC (UPF0109 family)